MGKGVVINAVNNEDYIEFLGIWEKLNNPDFNPIEFEGFRNQAGLTSFVLTSKKWIEATNAIGLVSKAEDIEHSEDVVFIYSPK